MAWLSGGLRHGWHVSADWLAAHGVGVDEVYEDARAHKHPEFKERTVWEVSEEERPKLIAYAGPFDGFHATR